MATAVIGLGSNLGDRLATLRRACEALFSVGSMVSVSSVYESAPVGGPEQGPYLNAVVVVDTELAARDLLDHLLAVEQASGRIRRVRWGPRTLDLDLLCYDHAVIEEPGLTVPHPRLTERRFVLAPLLEILPHAALPDGTALAPLLDAVADQDLRRLDASLSLP